MGIGASGNEGRIPEKLATRPQKAAVAGEALCTGARENVKPERLVRTVQSTKSTEINAAIKALFTGTRANFNPQRRLQNNSGEFAEREALHQVMGANPSGVQEGERQQKNPKRRREKAREVQKKRRQGSPPKLSHEWD